VLVSNWAVHCENLGVMAPKLVLLGLALLAVCTSAGQLSFTGVQIGDVQLQVVPGQEVSFVDVEPTDGPNSDSYAVDLQLQNTGKDATMLNLDIAAYVGSYPKGDIPSGDQQLAINTTDVSLSPIFLANSQGLLATSHMLSSQAQVVCNKLTAVLSAPLAFSPSAGQHQPAHYPSGRELARQWHLLPAVWQRHP